MENNGNNKGFTLAELLIVVAIIAVLVAIAIPVFTKQLERSREAADISNARAALAELSDLIIMQPDAPTGPAQPPVISDHVSGKSTPIATATVHVTQREEGSQSEHEDLALRIDGEVIPVSFPDQVVYPGSFDYAYGYDTHMLYIIVDNTISTYIPLD